MSGKDERSRFKGREVADREIMTSGAGINICVKKVCLLKTRHGRITPKDQTTGFIIFARDSSAASSAGKEKMLVSNLASCAGKEMERQLRLRAIFSIYFFFVSHVLMISS